MNFFIIILIFPVLALAEIRDQNINRDSSSIKKETFHSYSEVCSALGHKSQAPKIRSKTTLDCSGKIVTVGDFCEKEMADNPYYSRGFVNHTKKMVACWALNKVDISYQCAEVNNKSICGNIRDPKKSCEILGVALAKKLTLITFAFKKNSLGYNEVSCYFEKTPIDVEVEHGL